MRFSNLPGQVCWNGAWSGELCHHSVTVPRWRDVPARESLVTQLIAFRAQSCNQQPNLPDGQRSITAPIKILTLLSICTSSIYTRDLVINAQLSCTWVWGLGVIYNWFSRTIRLVASKEFHQCIPKPRISIHSQFRSGQKLLTDLFIGPCISLHALSANT